MIKNYVEILVERSINQLMADGEHPFSCTCENCIESIKAIALNALPPLYIALRADENAETIHEVELPDGIDVRTKVLNAKRIVEQNPKH